MIDQELPIYRARGYFDALMGRPCLPNVDEWLPLECEMYPKGFTVGWTERERMDGKP